MKKMMIALVAMLTIAATGKAMSYEQARNEALFLTDKMAYELNLTEQGNELRTGTQRGFVPDRQDGLRAELDGRAI